MRTVASGLKIRGLSPALKTVLRLAASELHPNLKARVRYCLESSGMRRAGVGVADPLGGADAGG